MYCHKCGQLAADSAARFCAHCGAQLQIADAAAPLPPSPGPSHLPPPLPVSRSTPGAVEIQAGERLLKEGMANHFKGIEAVGGKLQLTDRQLIFRSHAFNIQTHQESYPLESITVVKPRNTLGLVPNGLTVGLRDGREEHFVLFGRGEWMRAIMEARTRGPHA